MRCHKTVYGRRDIRISGLQLPPDAFQLIRRIVLYFPVFIDAAGQILLRLFMNRQGRYDIVQFRMLTFQGFLIVQDAPDAADQLHFSHQFTGSQHPSLGRVLQCFRQVADAAERHRPEADHTFQGFLQLPAAVPDDQRVIDRFQLFDFLYAK